MALWSISAVKKKDNVPGSSKWIRNELFSLHDLMVNDLEQFAYSVASEFTWIDEQMEEVINATEKNPLLLLESPKKLKGQNSPVKKLRDEALAMKSPLKELDLNVSRLSPIRFKIDEKSKPSSPVRLTKLQTVVPMSILPKPDELEKHIESNNPFMEEVIQDKIVPQVEEIEQQEKANEKSKSPEALGQAESSKHDEMMSPIKPQILKLDNLEQDDNDYDASIEENSFQAIRTAIRKSIIRQSKNSEELPEASEESTSKSADDIPQRTSLVVNPSIDSSKGSVSVETLKVPLKDDNDTSFKASKTPPRVSHRESQGFALLPHRGPLTVKSAKKKDSKPRKSLFDDFEMESREPTEKTSITVTNPIFPKSLYPSLDLANTNDSSSLPTSSNSPLQKITREQVLPKPVQSPSKLKQTNLSPLKLKLDDSERLQLSPKKLSQHSPEKKSNNSHSPFSQLFTSVGSTLKKAKSKFIKETQFIIDEAHDHEVEDIESPSKKSVVQPVSKLPDLTAAGSIYPKLSAETEDDPSPSPQKVETVHHDDIDEVSLSLKFSPVKSIYGSLRREMNKTLQNSPLKQDITSEVSKEVKRPNLARTSLAKPSEEQDSLRKSFARGGGLTSISLDPSKAKNRPRSFANEQPQQHGVKRKTQTEDEVRNVVVASHQPTRKIGAKIVPASVQLKQSQQDVKRRRTAEQLQNVLQKKAARVSNVTTEDHKSLKVKPLLQQAPQPQPQPQTQQPSKYQHSSAQSLMKTAVLQHARLNTETKNNPFNPKVPTTPSAPIALPEIFSESDDDEEGSVLKDWANSPELRNILINQQHIDPDKVFGPMAPLHMEEIFRNSSSRVSRFKNRGSSAQWSGTDALTIQEIESYKKKYKK